MKNHHKAILVASFCLPLVAAQASATDVSTLQSVTFSEASPDKILQATAPMLGMAYSELQGLYEDGCCTITSVSIDRYIVKVDGGDTIVVVITDI